MLFFRKKYTHEAFLSHAVEDRDAIVSELSSRLDQAGVETWYSARSLKTGEDLKREIQKAIDKSRFGIVVLTNNSVDREWPNTEYNWLEMKERTGMKVILPVLHEMTAEQLVQKGKRIGDRYCISSSRGMDFVIEKILEEIQGYRRTEKLKRIAEWLIALFALVALSVFTYLSSSDRPSDLQIQNAIDGRVRTLMNTINQVYVAPVKLAGHKVNQTTIDSTRIAFDHFKSRFRNEYEFNSGLLQIHSRKNVESVLAIDVVNLANSPGYGMDSVDIFQVQSNPTDDSRSSVYTLMNKRVVTYVWKGEKTDGGYLAHVEYLNGIQFINEQHTTPAKSSGMKRHEMTIVGLPPRETFHFEKDPNGEWMLAAIQ